MDGRVGALKAWLAGLPDKMAHGVPWAHVEPAGLGVGTPEAGDVEEREARKRREREIWRSTDGSAQGPRSNA